MKDGDYNRTVGAVFVVWTILLAVFCWLIWYGGSYAAH
jgi:hypothetical protein